MVLMNKYNDSYFALKVVAIKTYCEKLKNTMIFFVDEFHYTFDNKTFFLTVPVGPVKVAIHLKRLSPSGKADMPGSPLV